MIELTHSIRLDIVRNVDVGLHSLIVAVPRPLHHDLRRDAKRKRITDKGASASVRTEQSIFRRHFIDALVPFVVGLADRSVDPSKFGKLLEVLIHLLVGDHGQRLVVLKYHILVLLQDSLTVLVELDDQTVRSLNRSDFDMIFLDIASSKIVDIRVSQSSEALEEEDIPHTIKRLLSWRDLEFTKPCQLLPSQEDDLLRVSLSLGLKVS